MSNWDSFSWTATRTARSRPSVVGIRYDVQQSSSIVQSVDLFAAPFKHGPNIHFFASVLESGQKIFRKARSNISEMKKRRDD